MADERTLLLRTLPVLDDYAAQFGEAGGAYLLRDEIMQCLGLSDWVQVEAALRAGGHVDAD